MTDLPPRKRGRPSKADIAAREAAAANPPEPSAEDQILDEMLARPHQGRKAILTDDEETRRVIHELAKIGATQKEIAAVLGVSDRTLQNFLYDNPTAYEAWEDGQQKMKISLRRKQLSLADKNAPMAIFLGKNLLGQKDEHHTNMTVNKPAEEMSEQELLDIAARGAKAKKAEARDEPKKQVH